MRRDTDKERHSGSGSVGFARWLERIETICRDQSEYRAGNVPKGGRSFPPWRRRKSLLEIYSPLMFVMLCSCALHRQIPGIKTSCGCEVAEGRRRQGGLRISTSPRNQYLAVQGSLHYHQS
jgi:hypothetical protein